MTKEREQYVKYLEEANEFLFEAIDPELFSLENFILKNYLMYLIQDASRRWNLDAIVIRRLEKDLPRVNFEVLASYPIPEAKVKKYRVTMSNNMANQLRKCASESLLSNRYLYLTDISQPGKGFDQWKLAQEYKLNYLISFPLVVDSQFEGFIVYFRKEGDRFDNKKEKEFLGEKLNSLIERIFIFADSFHSIKDQHLKLQDTFTHEQYFRQLSPDWDLACRIHYVAKSYLNMNILPKAAENFYKAAEALSGAPKHISEVKFIVENYLYSAVVWAKTGETARFKVSYNKFKESFAMYRPYDKTDFYFSQIIQGLETNGQQKEASEIYKEKHKEKNSYYYFIWKLSSTYSSWVQKISEKRDSRKTHPIYEFLLKTSNKLILKPLIAICSFFYILFSYLVHLFWYLTSDCGETWWKWAIFSFGVIVLYAVVYMPCPWGEGYLELAMKNEYELPSYDSFFVFGKNFITATSFSITVFSTLGFGDTYPCNWIAQLAVSSQVLLGYAALGVFITLVSRKMTRR